MQEGESVLLNKMSVRFRMTYPAASEDAVKAFEALIGLSLPADYRTFLLSINGGRGPEPEGFRIETGERSMLADLYPIGDGQGYDLQAHFAHMKAELPDGVIRI